MQIYVHNRGDNVLVANALHGKDMFVTPRVDTTDLISYHVKEILSTKYKFLNKKDLPCYENAETQVKECLESFVERGQNCLLPWNDGKNTSTTSVCQTSENFQATLHQYLTSSEQALYDKTGCYTACTFTVRIPEQFQ
jgi:hypothetical protein